MEIDPIFPVPNFSAAQKIGCQGTNGANSETASQQFFPGRAVTFYPTFEHVFQAVERGEVEFGVLPVYNSTSGSVTPTYDLLGKYNCYITAMNQVKIKHCLAVRPGVSLEQIQAVYSHPQALLQCSDFLKYHNLKQIDLLGRMCQAKSHGHSVFWYRKCCLELYPFHLHFQTDDGCTGCLRHFDYDDFAKRTR